ncbi:hypothetical protein D8674_031423 [Pyrus ussuriensis x Pyrus communis]|uniref:Pectinesterase catalytic domain-containing protein n=1 Tax=Pyrus ussuriensis x Pyrus communis TaxID=2448454 RepID=A0A5N5EZP7_9ROSA|nr:hypothetical protein D8674_031423 [Pyrus ussuriensis x Pyrus communis]
MRTWLNTSQTREMTCMEAFKNGIDSKISESLRQVTRLIDEVIGMIQVQHHHHQNGAQPLLLPGGTKFEDAKLSRTPNATVSQDGNSDLGGNVTSSPTYLGRPWGKYSRTIFMQSYMSDVIRPEGWLDWNGVGELDTLYYAEYMNNGTGASTFIDGDSWLPSTGVPYAPGLEQV